MLFRTNILYMAAETKSESSRQETILDEKERKSFKERKELSHLHKNGKRSKGRSGGR